MKHNFALAAVALAAPLYAQSVKGKVLDASQGAIPGAHLHLTEANGKHRKVTAASDGSFEFLSLTPGRYELGAAHQGFERTAKNISVAAGEVLTVDLVLPVAEATTTVNIEASGGRATASRMDVGALDLPVTVNDVSSVTLTEQGANTMVDALRNVSGVSATRWYGMYEYYTVRGFNISDVVLVDGMRLEGNRINTQLNNVDQVEVLKGPSSVLYGGQALSGVINVVRKKPELSRTHDLFYRGGRFRSNQVGAGSGGSVFGSRRLLYRADLSFDDSRGWRDAASRRSNVSPAVTWIVNDRNRVTVNQAFNRDRFATDAGIPDGVLGISGFSLATRFNTPQDFGLVHDSQTHVLFSSNVTAAFEFRNSFFHRRTDDQYYSAETLTFRPATFDVARQFLYFKHHRRPVQNQADVVGRFTLAGMRHTILAGHEYQDYYNFTHRSSSRSVNIPPLSLRTLQETYVPVPDFPLSRIDYFSNKVNAVFWQDQVKVTGRLQLNLGGRFDAFRRSARNDGIANGVVTGVLLNQKRSQNAYTYRYGAVFSPVENQQLYFSANTSFQPVTQVPADGKELEPETGRSYEAGYRWQALAGKLKLSSAMYHMVRKNVVIARPNQLFDQAGQQSARGFDFDLNGAVGNGVRVIANYGYAQPRFDNFLISNGAVNLSGRLPRFVHKHAANIWLTKAWNSGWYVSSGMRYLSPMFVNNTNTSRLGGWTTFSGAAGWRRGVWDWSVNAENLLNRRRYFIAGIYDSQIYPGAPTNVFTTLRLRFR